MTMRATVIHVTNVPPRLALVLQLREGEVEAGHYLKSGTTTLRVDGVGFAPPDAWRAGKRAATVTVLSGPTLDEGAEVVEIDAVEIG